MLKAEFSKDISVGQLMTLNESLGLTVEINDGQVVTAYFEEVADEN